MTEQEWLQATDPTRMLKFLRGKASERKLRLFAVACCYRIWYLLTDKTGREAVEVAERFAEGEPVGVNVADFADYVHYRVFQYIDGYRKERKRNVAYHAVNAAYNSLPDVFPPEAFSGMMSILRPNLMRVPQQVAWAVAHHRRRGDKDEADETVFSQELAEQVPLLREVFGPLPFRPLAINPVWLVWHDGLLVSLAQKMYDSRDFRDMPVLADALEEAGCQDQDILNHCRQSGEHMKGCWVVDLVLDKS